ncbi:MAG: glycosyltransferase [Candidatus Daviesbacteria bacterium GW2011_GWA1_41_61]|uniref:Glycosyltransferase n=1 Tax=Candidatus Daviesbacteria bacterium GW2011_GWA2_40_9 TaxID=1618424 RepID=A0A0G0U077_9BACT|nr:MAG: family 2 glycosyl transferase [Candidatus Daviesbacteria bacterium GW2011_GWC1_40_9]KKR82559.1 MAG: glycosyltransferase [Candidatus Daviesbacteria bacterium GW2011_GWA2_40_9]KKR93011.1 MAG: glycosyltransferase [Candidatus Daviesbacteria bacterium GW2011_GWB1_41_15]KKS15555.1 MAG: glycosyltransferase [Candidatus Daviesbacteria bacterium GW2011_GWA1_41_61]
MTNDMVSVITVTYNSAKTIKECLDSVLASSLKAEILVVDNNSQDKTREIIKRYGKRVSLTESKKNLGFAKACNLAGLKARGNYLFILNPDAQIIGDSLAKLLKFVQNNPEVGIVAPQLIKGTNQIQPSIRKLPTLMGAVKEYYLRQSGSYEQYVPQSTAPVEVEAVYGAAMLIKKEVFQSLKGFNERYFLYYEDLDLCRRVKKAGFKIIYCPEAKVRHEIGASVKSIFFKHLPFGMRTLANFFVFKGMGSGYYQIRSGNIYHGFVQALIIRLLIYIAVKMRLYRGEAKIHEV